MERSYHIKFYKLVQLICSQVFLAYTQIKIFANYTSHKPVLLLVFRHIYDHFLKKIIGKLKKLKRKH